MRPRRLAAPRRWLALTVAGGAGALLAPLFPLVAGSCTVFDGLVAAGPDGAGDAGGDVESREDADSGKPTPAPTYLPLADAVRACSLVTRCPQLSVSLVLSMAIDVDPSSFSQCVGWLAGPIPPTHPGIAVQSAMLSCVAQAASCAAAGACVPIEQLAPGDPRCPDAGQTTPMACDFTGSTVLDCAYLQAYHCGTPGYEPGSHCLTDTDGTVFCASGSTCMMQPDRCLDGTFYESCYGVKGNLTIGESCAVSGNVCGSQDPNSGAFSCLAGGSFRPCTSAQGDCSAALVEVCDGLNFAIFDCAALGGTCATDQGLPRCVLPGDRCSPYDAESNVCHGQSIALCVGGKRVSFDCSSVGLACLPLAQGLGPHCG